MEWKIIFLAVILASATKCVPLEDVKPRNLPLLTPQDPPVLDSTQFFYKNNKEFGKREFAAVDDINYRLPNNSIPLRYDIWLKTDVDKKLRPFDGRVKIRSEILEPTSTITIHQRQLTIDQIDLYDIDNVLIEANLTHDYDATLEFMTIKLPRTMAIKDQVVLDISYHGLLRVDSSGFYRSRYLRDDDPDKEIWFAMTQFEQTDARHAFPCYDEPGIRVIYSVQIQHDSSFHALSNMPIIGRIPVEDTNYVTSKFEDTPPMQTYLLAFIISDYESINSSNTRIPQRIFAKPQSIARGDADYSSTVVGPILATLEARFGIKYPLPKMDHVAVTDYIWGAMEHYGLITYLEPRLLYNPISAPNDAARKTTNEIIAHEYTHQYFGNLVNPLWWSYTWLNEGFATFFQYYILDQLFPTEDYMERLENNAVARALDVDKNPNTWTLNEYVQIPTDINAKFGTVSYQKGGSVIRMFWGALGDAIFMKGLSYYLEEMYFKAATPQDLHRNIQKAFDESNPGKTFKVDAIMRTWEDQAGYPLVQVRKSGSSFVISQQRYNGGNEIYSIPLSYTTDIAADFNTQTYKTVMTGKEMTLTESGSNWIILNIQNLGYYEVRYEAEIWMEFFKTIDTNMNSIHVKHRAQFFRDMLKSIQENLLSDYMGILLMESLKKETNANVWSKANPLETYFYNKLFGTEIFTKYQEFMISYYSEHLERLGYNPIIGESQEDVTLRERAIIGTGKALALGTLNYEFERLKAYVDTGFGGYNLCHGMRLADMALYDNLMDAYLTDGAKPVRGSSLYQLGCSLEKNILKKFMGEALNPTNNLETNERVRILSFAMTSSVIGLETTMEFVKENFMKINEVLPTSLEGLFNSMIPYIQSEKHFNSYKEILNILINAAILEQVQINSFEATITSNMKWHEKNLGTVEQALNGETIVIPTDPPTTTVTTPSTPSTPSPTPTAPSTLSSNPSPTTPSPTPTTPSTTSTTLGASTTVVSLTAIILCTLIKLMA